MVFQIMFFLILYCGIYFMANVFHKVPFINGLCRSLIFGSIFSIIMFIGIIVFDFFYGIYSFFILNDNTNAFKFKENSETILMIFLPIFLLIIGLLLRIIEGQKNEE